MKKITAKIDVDKVGVQKATTSLVYISRLIRITKGEDGKFQTIKNLRLKIAHSVDSMELTHARHFST